MPTKREETNLGSYLQGKCGSHWFGGPLVGQVSGELWGKLLRSCRWRPCSDIVAHAGGKHNCLFQYLANPSLWRQMADS